MKLKYVTERKKSDGSKTLYWQRKIPLDLLPRYAGKGSNIKVNLNTDNWSVAARMVEALNHQHETIWEAMRGNPSIVPSGVRAAAIEILKQHGLNPSPYQNHEADIDKFISQVLEPKRIAFADGDDETYYQTHPKEFLSPVEQEALAILKEPPKFLLSEALDFYLSLHKKSKDTSFRVSNKRIWDKLVSIVGDMPFEQLSRADVNAYVAKRLAQNVKTGTVRRNLNSCGAIYRRTMKEREILKANPFDSVIIPGEGTDEEKRESLSQEQLQLLARECIAHDDDMRWALAMQMDLGSRIGEVVGLTLDDIVLDQEIPHVIFEPKPWRTIKTNESRLVPLVGMSLWAAKRVKENAIEGQFFAFPRYNPKGRAGKTSTDSASASLNKYMRSLGLDKTTHELRHTMRDRLTNANAIALVMDAIGGWGKQNIGATYGKGPALELMYEWLSKVVIKV